MLKILLINAFCVISNIFFSQIQETKVERIIEQINKQETVFIIPENTGTYEEQGFKKSIEKEKIVYRKEVNGVIIEFRPKEQ